MLTRNEQRTLERLGRMMQNMRHSCAPSRRDWRWRWSTVSARRKARAVCEPERSRP